MTEQWPLFCFVILTIVLCPGPMNILVLANATHFGFRSSLATMIGGAMAYLLQMILVTISLQFLFANVSYLLDGLKILGAIYLIYLGYQRWIGGFGQIAPQTDQDSNSGNIWVLFSQGFITAASNPKSLLIFSIIFPQFIVAEGNLIPQLMLLGISFSVIQFLGVLLYAQLGARLIKWLAKRNNPKLAPRFIGGIFMMAGTLLIWPLISKVLIP